MVIASRPLSSARRETTIDSTDTTYATQREAVVLDGKPWEIQSLLDRNQYADPLGTAAALGISSAEWPIFGMIWPSSYLLVEVMLELHRSKAARALATPSRYVELGCGLGLAPLVLSEAGANVTATDQHPLCDQFLQTNARTNDTVPPLFERLDWTQPGPSSRFDVLFGSDLLYEPHHPALLASCTEQLTSSSATVIIIDKPRGLQGKFEQALGRFGFAGTRRKTAFDIAGKVEHALLLRLSR